MGKWRQEHRNAWDRKMHDVGRVKAMLAAAGKVLQVRGGGGGGMGGTSCLTANQLARERGAVEVSRKHREAVEVAKSCSRCRHSLWPVSVSPRFALLS